MRYVVWVALACLACPALASEAGYALQPMTPNMRDLPSLQRGSRIFFNYCSGCHSLKYQRYEKTADDLKIPHDVALETLIFTGQKIGGLIETAMPPESNNWFGAAQHAKWHRCIADFHLMTLRCTATYLSSAIPERGAP